MNDKKKISMAVIRRLPKYHRYLQELLDEGVMRISSKELSKIIGFTASQIRQDLNNFGGFGQQGYGYNVQELFLGIQDILALKQTYKTVIIGAGNMGQALANYPWNHSSGFEIQALFDINPKLVGLTIHGMDIYDIETLPTYIQENQISVAFICTPKERAQEIADILSKTSIQGIWNFSPIDLDGLDDIVVENVHLSDSLFVLSYLLNEETDECSQRE